MGAVNLFVLYKFIKALVTPFNETEAFKLGIIDSKGTVLKKRKQLKTSEEKSALSFFHILVFNLKKLLGKLPAGSTRLGTLAAALWLLKEEKNQFKNMPSDEEFVSLMEEAKILKGDIPLLEEDAPVNAVGSGNIAGTGKNPPVSKKRQRKFANNHVFEVDDDTFYKARMGKRKHVNYRHYIKDEKTLSAVKEYAQKNPSRPVILSNRAGAMLFLKYGKERW